jgi:hypothetical protein
VSPTTTSGELRDRRRREPFDHHLAVVVAAMESALPLWGAPDVKAGNTAALRFVGGDTSAMDEYEDVDRR